jgi:hypothetical protein
VVDAIVQFREVLDAKQHPVPAGAAR